jgi:iron complex transport system ATP-binding protein
LGVSLIQIAGLSLRRRRNAAVVLEDVELEVAAGDILCILGPNGAGKSTLLGCLLALIEGWTGTIRLAGRDIRSLSRREIARLAAYVPQSSETTFAFDVYHMVLVGRTSHFSSMGAPSASDRRWAELAIERVDIVHLRDRSFTELSGGERQLVLIARALAQDAPIIVMDEPTASLDLGNQRRVLSVIRDLRKAEKAVIMTSHLPDQAFILDCRVALMQSGRISASGSAAGTCSETAMNALYGTRLRKLSDPMRSSLRAYVPDLD